MNQVFIKVPIKWCIKVLIYDNFNNLCILLQFFIILHNKMLDHINPFKKVASFSSHAKFLIVWPVIF